MGYAPSAPQAGHRLFDENEFSDLIFEKVLSDYEKRTTWTYSGATDLLLLNSWFSPELTVYLDFTNVFIVQLETAIKSKLISSAGTLIEEIMRQSREHPPEDVVMKVSDVLFLRTGVIRYYLG